MYFTYISKRWIVVCTLAAALLEGESVASSLFRAAAAPKTESSSDAPPPSLAVAEEDEEEALEPPAQQGDELPPRLALANLRSVATLVPVPAPAPEVVPVQAEAAPEIFSPASSPSSSPAFSPVVAPAPALPSTSTPVKVRFSLTVQNVDYSKLSHNTDLLDRFVGAMTQDIVKHSGGGTAATDVKLQLLAGSVIVQAVVDSAGGEDTTALKESLAETIDDGTLAKAMQSSLNELPGIGAVTTGALKVVDVSEPSSGDEAVGTARDSANVSPKTKPPKDQRGLDDEVCEPACMVGRGICVDNVCFCRAPFTGKRCETKLQMGHVRISYLLVASFGVIAMFIGSQVAIFIYKATSSTQQQVKGLQGDSSGPKKETWKPRSESSRGRLS